MNKLLKLYKGNCEAFLHVNPELEVILVNKGKVLVSYENSSEELSEGQAALILPFHPHGFKSDADSVSTVMMFDFNLAKDVYEKYLSRNFIKHKFLCNAEELSYVNYVLGNNDLDVGLVKSLYYMFLHLFLKNNVDYCEIDKKKNKVSRLLQYIYEHMDENLTIDVIAKEFNSNRNSVSKLLNDYSEVSFSKLLRGMRVEKAKLMIEDGEFSITEISYRCGFGTTRSLNRAFQEYLGTTPTYYKNNFEKISKKPS